ncbi:unnamed protein product [Meloidogyne enterolobii]|uniref:Uncharacterized protein n=1 Tax=Meloidogyne enterolobii TaxID=390850 RepID=A0ACB1A971_MELEN
MNLKNSKTILILNLVLRKDETLTKHYKLYFEALKNSINQQANKIIVDYLLWFRWVDNSVKEKNKWQITNNCISMREVIKDSNLFLKISYGMILWSDEETIEKIQKEFFYRMYFLKEYIGVQQKDKLRVSKIMNIKTKALFYRLRLSDSWKSSDIRIRYPNRKVGYSDPDDFYGDPVSERKFRISGTC